jgi:formate-dependent nitrite reductase membrane component NrfD
MELWGYQIWLEMWLGGMAGGAFLVAFLYELFSGQKNKQLLRPATFIGIPLVIIALILALLDLGETFRFWHMMVVIKPLSPIWVGAILLGGFVGLSIIMALLYIVAGRKGADNSKGILSFIGLLSWINAVIAAVLIAYSGVMLAASNIPLWASTPLMPALFAASGAATGTAILIFSALIYRGAWQESGETLKKLSGALAIVVIIQVLLLAGLVAMAGDTAKVLMSGSLMMPFFADIGLLVLSIILIIAARAKIEKGGMRGVAILASLLVILGGLLMRAIIIIGGQS